MKNKLPYCGELVRRYDPDRFLISLMMSPPGRPALWALYAFNYEIAKTREVVTDTTIGLIRLQWWRDALAKIYEDGTVLPNEILPDLHKAIDAYDLPKEWFDELLYAREFDLENVLPASLEGLENYACYTNMPLMRLALKVGGQEESEEVIRAVSTAYGLTGLLRAAPFHAQQQRCYMPADLLAEHGVSERSLYDLKPDEGFKDVASAVGARAQALLGNQPESRLCKAHARLARIYLSQIKNLQYDVFSPGMLLPPPFFHLRFAFFPL